jgi:hypothetical protein
MSNGTPIPARIRTYLGDRQDDLIQLSAVLECINATCSHAQDAEGRDAEKLWACEQVAISAATAEAERLSDRLDPDIAQRTIELLPDTTARGAA